MVHKDIRSALPSDISTDSFNQTLKMVVKAGPSATLFAAALTDDKSGRIYTIKASPPKDKDLAHDELEVLKVIRDANYGHGLPFCARLLADFETSPGVPASRHSFSKSTAVLSAIWLTNRHRVTIEPTQIYTTNQSHACAQPQSIMLSAAASHT